RAKRLILALLERFERDHYEGCIRLRVVVDEIQTDDRRKVRDGFLLAQDLLGLTDCLRRSRDCCAAGHLHYDEQCTLVVFRQESCGGNYAASSSLCSAALRQGR